MKQIIQDLLILIFLILILLFLWFSKGLIFAGGEEGIPFYDLNKTIQLISYSWQDVSAGYPSQLLLNRIPYFSFLKIFSSLGLPGFIVQALHFFIIMAFGAVSFYFLLHETVDIEIKGKRYGSIFKFVPLIGAVFYLLNPFSMTQIWGRGIYLQFFPFALFPFFLLMFILGLRSKNFVYGIFGLLVSVLFGGSFGNPSYIFSLWIILLIYCAYFIFRNRQKKEIIFSLGYFLFMLGGWILIHMWWVYPFIKVSANQFAAALNNSEENLGTLRGISKDYQLPSLLRLIHEGYFFRDQKYGESYLTFTFTLISWLIPVSAFFSYSIFKKLRILLFFGILFLFSLFICLGANLPTGWLFVFIFKTFPAFQAFRNPLEKFGVVLTMAYAPFFAIGAINLSNRIGKVFQRSAISVAALTVILFLVYGVFLWPIWTGQFAGGLKLNPWVKVPEDYKSLNEWLGKQEDDGTIIHFPINPGDGLRYSGWEYPYQGIEPGEYLYARPSLGKYGQPQKFYYKFLMDRFEKKNPNAYGPDPDFSNSEFKSSELFEELAKLNVRYIILHSDIDPILGNFGESGPVADYLNQQKNISKAVSFGKLDVYKVEIPINIQLIYSPDTKISYEKINPTLYKVTAGNIEKPFDLFFLENYDPNWELILDGQKVENHGRIFSYANKWTVEKTGTLSGVLKYSPQDFVNEGMNITKGVILVFSLICLPFLGWKIWKLKKI